MAAQTQSRFARSRSNRTPPLKPEPMSLVSPRTSRRSIKSTESTVPCHLCQGMAFESWLAEKAREELEVLEAKHPSRFHRLKRELKSLISHPDPCAQLFFCPAAAAAAAHAHDDDTALSFTPTSAAPTQVSSNRKRKIEWSEEEEEEVYWGPHRKNKAMKDSAAERFGDGSGKNSRSSSVEAAIRRAEACLEMIRKVKQSLFC